MIASFGRNGLRVSALAAAIVAAGGAAPIAKATEGVALAPKSVAAIENAQGRELYIIGLRDPALAMYEGGRANLAAVPRLRNGRMDVKSAAALAYVDFLRAEQDRFLASISGTVGRSVAPLAPQFRFQHAFNGMVLALTDAELAAVSAHPDVTLVEGYKEFALSTDAGPTLIGAPTLWNGSNSPGNVPTRGEGVVIGIIDSGANLGSPSFTDIDGEGYDHVNPLGAGTYLGWCNPANPNHNPTRDVCNDKLIGGWDFTDTAAPGGSIEAAGFEDENGHGSHTASTAAGNRRTAVIAGVTTSIAGVAPRANLVIYDACYTNTAGQGLCPNVSTLGSINQVVADGIIDAVNFSISGSQSPWTDANAQAFLAAHNAGVFVAASAGNGNPNPGPGAVNHVAPWVTTVAASTHSRAFYGNLMNFVGGPTPPPAATNVALRPGVAPPFISAPLTNVPIVLSPTFGDGTTNTDGCSAFPAGTFVRGGTAAIALIRWSAATSGCGTIARVNNAGLGGAAGVIFLADVPLNAAAGGTVPAWVLDDPAVVAAVRAQAALGGDAFFIDGFEPTPQPADPARVTIAFPGQAFPGQADVMAGFSLLGPANLDLLKPDITGPGVNILAAVSRWTGTPPPGSLNPAQNGATGLLSGTSMSSPHLAGAAALLRALNPSLTPSEVKSAIVSTARTQDVFKSSATAPATVPSDPFDRGGGRVDLTRAAKAGLVMNETGANFTAANPATGGNPATLNLASLQLRNCVGTCTVNRTVRSTATTSTTWTATVAGLPAGVGTVTPASFTLAPGATQALAINIDASTLSQTAFTFGEAVLTPDNNAVVEQRFPLAIRAAAPDIAVSNTAGIAVSVPSGQTGTATFAVSNTGNPTINWALASGTQTGPLLSQPQFLGNGFISAQFAGRTPPNTGSYIADDFTVSGTAQVTTLRADGFALPGGTALGATNSPFINFHVYADNGGVPAGAPEGFGAAPVYALRVPSNAAGLTLTGNNIAINLVTNGAPALNLASGRYWVTVFPEMPGAGTGTTGNPLWAWRITGVGAPVNGLAPRTITPAGTSPAWAVPTLTAAPGPGPASGFTLSVNGNVGCGAPWLSAAPTSGSLGALSSTTVTLTINAATLAAGSYGTYVCVSSEGTDPDEPMTLVPVNLTVTPASP
jgi:subtilisin family serine protease